MAIKRNLVPAQGSPPHAGAAQTICGIVPPFLLQRVAAIDSGRPAQAARNTLLVQQSLRVRRETRMGKRLPGERQPSTSFVPPHLQRQQRLRAHAPQPDLRAAGAPQQPAAPHRSIYDAQQDTKLPGVLRRGEGDAPHTDESVNEAYDGLGATWELYYEAYERNSLDNAGLPLVASVHFSKDYDNAFWDGQQMVFGDGDGEIFASFTDCPDVIGHELTHGVTQYTAGLVYVGQSGALNEHVSDVFGVLTLQRLLGHDAAKADWLVGKGIFMPGVQGVALRSMKAPGTAYDDPRLGKDPQPATMDGYVELPHDDQHDNGGVHINSGIPNHAFYLAATQIGGNAWEAPGRIWYHTLTRGGLAMDSDFADFAGTTLRIAGELYGPQSAERAAVQAGWDGVGVQPAQAKPAQAKPAQAKPAQAKHRPARTRGSTSSKAAAHAASTRSTGTKDPKDPRGTQDTDARG